MDVDQLIASVFKRPPIWDKRTKEYANRNNVDRAWKEISEEMDIEGAVLRKKWKNLRDYFATEYTKRPVARSGDGADCPPWKSKWQYFNQLLFLKDIVAPRKCSGSLCSLTSSIDVDTESERSQNSSQVLETTSHAESESVDLSLNINVATDANSMVSCATSPTSTPVQTPTPPPQDTRVKKRRADSSQYEKILEIEQQKIQLLTERCKRNDVPDDDDLLFLKSLHPYVKRIPFERKMVFRSRMQLLIEEFSEGRDTNHYEQLPSVYRPFSSFSTVDTYQSCSDNNNIYPN